MRYVLFLAANALLFIRPSEFVAELNAVELYRYAIIASLLISLPIVLQQFTLRFQGVPPIAGCVLALFPAILLSNLVGGNSDLLVETATEFFKVVIYYLLLLALLTSLGRLRSFLQVITICCAGLAVIAVVRYHADIELPTPEPTSPTSPTTALEADGRVKAKKHGTFVIDKVKDEKTGALVNVQRMCGTGIFNDPNDLALALVCAIPLCVYWVTDPTKAASRPLWLGLIVLFAYALMLTHSRGGFLALMASVGILLHARFGMKKTLLLGALVMPLLLVVFAGRMTAISSNEDTAQSRIQLWSDGLMFFQMSPLTGVGADNYTRYSNHVAHNSFIHCYTELGIIGGTFFVGAFYFALRGLYDMRAGSPAADPEVDAELRRLHPYLLAMVAGYAVGIGFLSRSYVVPTYMILGLATVYLRLHTQQLSLIPPRWTRLNLPRLAGVSFGFLIVANVFVRMFVSGH